MLSCEEQSQPRERVEGPRVASFSFSAQPEDVDLGPSATLFPSEFTRGFQNTSYLVPLHIVYVSYWPWGFLVALWKAPLSYAVSLLRI